MLEILVQVTKTEREMGTCPNWMSLPNLVLIEIFSYLNRNEKIQASSVCKFWRSSLFYPKFWRGLHLNFIRDPYEFEKSSFLSRHIPFNFLEELVISFDFDKCCLDYTLDCLESVAKSNNLQKLKLKTNKCSPLLGKTATKSVIIEAVQRLKEISVNAKKLRLLDLGYMEGLLYVAHKLELLELLGRQNGNTLKQLNIATIKENLDSQLFIRINPEIFYSLKTLTSLSLDYDYFNDDILHMFCNSSRVPLLKLHLIVQNIDISHRGTSNNSWTRFVLSNPDCQLHISVICSGEAVALLHSHILQPAMPLSKFSTYFCEQVNESALEVLSTWYDATLRSVSIVDPLFFFSNHEEESPPNLLAMGEILGRVDPLVMMAWKCRRLESITLIGYQYSDIGLIGIARLCGPKLRELNIPDLCINYDVDGKVTTRVLSKAVSEALSRKWRPLKTEELDATIVDPNQRYTGWDSYVLSLIDCSRNTD